ncbi:avidin/streptavidin family protein [Streptomyces sp. NPDC048179]|uniref:avidin/streptavidin family protein n=1 Tax=Streptomyces sp. NPDC048179 TaxID=3365506 RepID=UPI00371F439E
MTSWSGPYHEDGEERICATWLLTVSAIAANTWEATAVGQDVYHPATAIPGRSRAAPAARRAHLPPGPRGHR